MWPLLVLAGLSGFGKGYFGARKEREAKELEKKRGLASSLIELAGTGAYTPEQIPAVTEALGKVYGVTDTGDIEKMATGIAKIAATENLTKNLTKADEIIKTNISEGWYGSIDDLVKDIPNIAMVSRAPLEEVSKIAESYITRTTKTLPSLGLSAEAETPPTLEKEPYPSLRETPELSKLWAERLSLTPEDLPAQEGMPYLKGIPSLIPEKTETSGYLGPTTITEEKLRTPLGELERKRKEIEGVLGRPPTDEELRRWLKIAPNIETKYEKDLGAFVTIEDGKVTGFYEPPTLEEKVELDDIIKMIQKFPKDMQSKIKVSINPVTGIKNIEVTGETHTAIPTSAWKIFTHDSLLKYFKTGNMDVLVPKPEGQTVQEKSDVKYYGDWIKKQLGRIKKLDPLEAPPPEEGDEEAYSNAQAGLNLIEKYRPSLSREELLRWMDYFDAWFKETKGEISFQDYLANKGVLRLPLGYTPPPSTRQLTKQKRAPEVSKILSGGRW